MTTKTVRITLENLKFLKSIDDDINKAILKLQQEIRFKEYCDNQLKEPLSRIEHKLNFMLPITVKS